MNRKRQQAAQRATQRPPAARAPAEKKIAREAPTIPPPGKQRESDMPPHVEGKISGVRPARRRSIPMSATIDEVTADLSRDPRRDDD
jgi:hypothetical protein